MRLSLNWLRDYVDVTVDVSELATRLDMSGTKVETVRRPGAGVDGVVVAEVLDIEPHPNADTLILVDVATGDGATQRVVCGAHNFSVGDRVPLARVGARLPGMTIAERKIRGEMSQGMLCSPAELEVSKDHSGILVLPPSAAIGDDVVDALGLDDVVMELEVTPNRPDCMGMIGLAREVAALTGAELRVPDADARDDASVAADVRVDVLDPHGCPRYVARVVSGVSTAPSPAWLGARLTAAGIRPISAVVDVSNYVMLETGQPLHAFDAAEVAERHIVVRRAEPDETLVTLDGVKRTLDPSDLLIADPARALAIAGVMGGEDSEVSETTREVILEAAHFDKASVSYTSRRHQLRSEASARFERGTDPNGIPFAAARAVGLMAELTGGAIASEVVDAYPEPLQPARITLHPDRTSALLGFEVEPDAQARALRSLQLDVVEAGKRIEVTVPTFRRDLKHEQDLIEEVARLVGFDALPSTLPRGAAGGLERDQVADRRLRRAFVGLGVYEAWTPSFMSDRDLDDLGLDDDDPARRAVALSNPMTEDERWMRTTLLPGLLRSVARNAAHRASGAALFEIARVYRPSNKELPDEEPMLGLAFSGLRTEAGWASHDVAWDLYAVKGVVEQAFRMLGVGPLRFEPLGALPYHPTRAATVALGGEVVGTLGELHPEVCERFDAPERTVAGEIALRSLFASLPGRPRFDEPPRFPGVYQDLAVVVDDAVPAGRIERLIADAGAPEVTSIRLFDVYRGEQIPAGKKSLAYALEMRAPNRTLTDDDARGVRERIITVLRERTGAELRT